VKNILPNIELKYDTIKLIRLNRVLRIIVRNSLLWKLDERCTKKNKQPLLPLPRQRRVKFSRPYYTKKGNPSDIARGSIIQIFTGSTVFRPFFARHNGVFV